MDEARLYTVRVWQHAQQFRAVVCAVGDEGAELFTEPAAVAAFLQQASGAGFGAGVGAAAGAVVQYAAPATPRELTDVQPPHTDRHPHRR